MLDAHGAACCLSFGADLIVARAAMARAGGSPQPWQAVCHAVLVKIMAKCGLSSLAAYKNCRLMQPLGLAHDVTRRLGYEDGDVLAGPVGLEDLDTPQRHEGMLRQRRTGEAHRWARSGARIVHEAAVVAPAIARAGDPGRHPLETGEPLAHDLGFRNWRHYNRTRTTAPASAIVDLLDFTRPVDLEAAPDEVLSVNPDIVGRMSSGAISLGSINSNAHGVLAEAMNLLGAKSNSGEGGEPSRRPTVQHSAIRQVASGRFGVTQQFLAQASEVQIKMNQGSKPGEGGHLPGHKVTAEIAALRNCDVGCDLISPAPHHDIYSIEDLAQLIHDLRCVGGAAHDRAVPISVKLAAGPDIGAIACGCAKAGADIIVIAGGAGGTGSSPLGSLLHAGMPTELAVAEAHAALVTQGLRHLVRLRAEGGVSSAHDAVKLTLLGADEWGFGTLALLAQGCVMARVCHKGTCPAGIATHDPRLVANFNSDPAGVARVFAYLARDIERLAAQLAAAPIGDLVGVTHLLRSDTDWVGNWLGGLPAAPRPRVQWHPRALAAPPRDAEILAGRRSLRVRNTDRSLGTYASARTSGRLALHLEGFAGQSLAAFTSNLDLVLTGAACDYVGKGLCGSTVAICPPSGLDDRQVLVGNAALYGATAGTLMVAGRAGARFGVRNSGAVGVALGAGPHFGQYQTRGMLMCAGPVGANVGAGWHGGVLVVPAAADIRADCQRVELSEFGTFFAELSEQFRCRTGRSLALEGLILLARSDPSQELERLGDVLVSAAMASASLP